MAIGRLSPKTKACLAVAMALLLWIPQGISSDTQPVVTGHSTFFNGQTYDKCLASVAGIVRSRVLWFNNQVLIERYPGKGTFVYITEHGGQDPTSARFLSSQGTAYNFADPNGARWNVQELYIDNGYHHVENADAGGVTNTGDTPGPNNVGPNDMPGDNVNVTQPYATEDVSAKRQYVWVVELASQPIFDDFPGSDAHTYYNFLDLVDTCKFNNNTATYGGLVNHTGTESGHPTGETSHSHYGWNADIYLGTAPTVVIAGDSSNPTPYETSWATDGNAADAVNGAGAVRPT
jgi:hypothetical protein